MSNGVSSLMGLNIKKINFKDDKLLEQLQYGRKEAQKTFYEQYYSNMFSIAYGLLDSKEDVEDILQTSFDNAFRKIDQFEGRSSLKSWLTSIVINECYSLLRKKNRNVETSIESMEEVFDKEGFRIKDYHAWKLMSGKQTDIESKFDTRTVRETINRLPENYKTVLILRDIEGYSIKETVDILDISEQNVKSRLHRARTYMKNMLKESYGNGNVK